MKLSTHTVVLCALLVAVFATGSAEAARPKYCSAAPQVGPCKAQVTQYFFNTTKGDCDPFNWGGCDGKDSGVEYGNRFTDMKACMVACPSDAAQALKKDAEIVAPKTTSKNGSISLNEATLSVSLMFSSLSLFLLTSCFKSFIEA